MTAARTRQIAEVDVLGAAEAVRVEVERRESRRREKKLEWARALHEALTDSAAECWVVRSHDTVIARSYRGRMGWSVGEARALLREAFPWGAHVTVASGSTFVASVCEVAEDVPPDPVPAAAGEAITVRFVRDEQSDALATVTRSALEAATRTGQLRFAHGGGARQVEVDDLHLLADPMRDFVGPQSSGEGKWIARMRLHQAWWRTFRLRVPFGTGPKRNSKKPFGNMLDEDADEAGLNFLTDEARAAYKERKARTLEGIDSFRTRRHLMASQTMAFNVFGHLDSHRELAADLFDLLLGPGEVEEVTGIEIERLSDALGDHTAFDTFVTYRRPGRANACIAIETKLTEPFSQTAYDWDQYVAHSAFDHPGVWTTRDTSVLGDLRWSQLWRNHLLARAESAVHNLGPASMLVVHHPEDSACDTNVAGYCKQIKASATVQAVDLGRIHLLLSELAAGDDKQQQWLADLADRYLNLRLSEGLVPIAAQAAQRGRRP